MAEGGDLPAVAHERNPWDNGSVEIAARETTQQLLKRLESRSICSGKSSRSARSTKSNISLRKLDAISEAAALEVQLQHMDTENKLKAELEKAQAKTKLAMAKARLIAIMRLDQEDSSGEGDDPSLPGSDDAYDRVNEYVKSTAASGSNHGSDHNVADVVPHNRGPEPQDYKSPMDVDPQLNSTEGLAPQSDNKVCTSTPVNVNAVIDSSPPVSAVLRDDRGLVSKSPTLSPVKTAAPIDADINVAAPSRSETDKAVPSKSETDKADETHLLLKSFAEKLDLGRLPPPEPGIFTGNALDYTFWKTAFETLIERKGIHPSERLYYLQRYIGGEAREAVQGYFLLGTPDAYVGAKNLLEERYGNSFAIASAFRNKMDAWNKIPARDGLALRRFGDFLRQCETAMAMNEGLKVLNDMHENRKLVAKLPDWLIHRWSRVISEYKEKEGKFPPFSRFVKFVVSEAKIACEPILAGFTQRETKSTTNRSQQQPSRSMSTGAMPYDSTQSCPCCEKNHLLQTCQTFLKKPLNKRKDFIKTKGLCFACLKGGHRAKDCRKRAQCGTCQRRHPTALHGDIKSPKPKESKTDASADLHGIKAEVKTAESHSSRMTSIESKQCSMIVPVWVSHVDNPEEEMLVYALLDTQSDTSFILENTCQKLGVHGTSVELRLSTMTAENTLISSEKVSGLKVRGYDSNLEISLPAVYTREIMPANREHIPTPEVAMKWPHLNKIAHKLSPLLDCEVGLLIGYNCPRALVPRDVIPSMGDEPYAQRTDLGWGVVGIVNASETDNPLDNIGVSHRIVTSCADGKQVQVAVRAGGTKEVITPHQVIRFLEIDFNEQVSNTKTLSQDDKRFIKTLKEGIHRRDDLHYEMPLPFKRNEPNLPSNKMQALHRLKQTKNRFMRDPLYKKHYVEFMHNIIEGGFAEQVPEPELKNPQAWYIPHHGVYHPKKPDKIRIVFDCSARYMGEALNDHLLQGPHMTNTLIGVMCRFRREPIAVICDIQQMFFQFGVNKEHRDYLRFLWWTDGNHETEPVEFRMRVHLFGATSSPSCASFGLKQIADDYESEYGSRAADFLRHDFYVDDGVASVGTSEEAIELIQATRDMCAKGGLHLHKLVSNSKAVLASVPPTDRAQGIKDIDLLLEEMPVERALGVQWCVESDTFQFRITMKDKPLTRRGILSTISSIFDPFGFLAPVLLVGKQILQQMCREGLDWDSPLPEKLRSRWEIWRNSLGLLADLRIQRCYKPENFGEIKVAQLHHFSDASMEGYGQCSYLRLINDQKQVYCTLLMGKSRVTPLKTVTIPRLELAAAVVSVKVSNFLKQELQLAQNVEEFFWTDSKVVLGYIKNDTRRFHVYVANRVQQIRDHTDPTQWQHVTTNENPADDASRGITPQELCATSRWLSGPEFLWKQDIPVKEVPNLELSNDDPEVKKAMPLATNVDTSVSSQSFQTERLEHLSSWTKARRAVANCMKLKTALKRKVTTSTNVSKQDNTDKNLSLTVASLYEAECEIIKAVQAEVFPQEMKILSSLEVSKNAPEREQARQRNQTMKITSSLYRLDPFLDDKGIMRVGGRIRRAELSAESKHPVILPRKHHITELVVRHFHERVEHQGRGMTTGEIRANGFWIIGCSSAVSSHIAKCVKCRKLRSNLQVQKMADLPPDRLEPAPPFTYCGVDYFGPWYIREGRSDRKKYGVLFTCLVSRAIHIETANSLSTDSFLNALRRFIAIRGPIRLLRSDQGTNFVGARSELKEAFDQIDQKRVERFLLRENCDYFEWKMNVPHASHMGGVWERQIRTVRSVLNSLMSESGAQLDDESLRTFMCEASAIVNSRPLSVENLYDPTSLTPLTPNHLLTMKTRVVLPPPGEFDRADLYCRKRWRRVQHLVNEFWARWKKEFLQALQARPKWTQSKRDFQRGDIVIVKDESTPRNKWPLARVEQAYVDSDGHVRKVKLAISDKQLDSKGKRSGPQVYLERPIHKLVLLLEGQV